MVGWIGLNLTLRGCESEKEEYEKQKGEEKKRVGG
jgi:hypothetical protein